jgi:hypothetical protein
MPKSKTPSKEISTRGVLKKVRKPPAPPARVHPSKKQYKRLRIRIAEEEET